MKKSIPFTFLDHGKVNIQADCNNAMASYTIDGSSITIEDGPVRLAAAPINPNISSLTYRFCAHI